MTDRPRILRALISRLTGAGRAAADPADRAPVQTREEILQEAADWSITGWPGPRWEIPRPTVAAVQQEALLRAGVEVTEQEAAEALAARLRFRGYA